MQKEDICNNTALSTVVVCIPYLYTSFAWKHQLCRIIGSGPAVSYVKGAMLCLLAGAREGQAEGCCLLAGGSSLGTM